MPLDTYENLKTAIIDELDRGGDADLLSKVDDFIDLAEARHRREVRIRGMISRSQASVAQRYLALPEGFVQMDTLRLLTDPLRVLTEVALHELNRMRRTDSDTGTPLYFAVHEEIEFDRIPGGAITAEMIYYKALTPLSDAAPTNALLLRASDVYFYGALVASSPWVGEDERLTTWSALYNSAVESLAMDDRRSRHNGALATRVSGTFV